MVWPIAALGGVGFNVMATIIFGIKDSNNIGPLILDHAINILSF